MLDEGNARAAANDFHVRTFGLRKSGCENRSPEESWEETFPRDESAKQRDPPSDYNSHFEPGSFEGLESR